MWGVEAKDWVTVGATVAGPILAVQAQKWVERARASVQRRDWIFSTLMATRQDRVSMEHVRALNMIDLAFYGRRVLGKVWRSKGSQAVLDAWHDYHAHLTIPVQNRPANEGEQRDWNGRCDELFTNLLDRLAAVMSYKFERAALKGGSYSPEAHGTVALQQQAIRHLAIEVLAGNKNLPMEVKAWPVDAAVAEQQRNTQAELVQNQREMMGDFKQILERLAEHAVGPRAEALAPAEPEARINGR
ncbi:Uncharacterised protein [Burkholderia pseudomallei]|nr:hypothetical protein DP55_720 [Burkholderia pseudomallei]AIV46528.1 hypothetical protein X988_2275 [Burkholderia pseudomallei TSV 48]AIV85956.1 hypothetical protein X978_1205 [Burkholderia pseudomallei MSHR3965]AJX07746.1 hypothetical protein BBW_3118 [Burkholderia pseudomallei 1026b]AJX23474.1 hypothetical protein BG17_3246 [Burkholderia pseudomallei MSHR491]EQA88658.1 hypothetical protein M218_12885 [Burkholderia pseudomallei MSHR338]KGV60844.1 hypothetical protein X898_2695 [Burkholderi